MTGINRTFAACALCLLVQAAMSWLPARLTAQGKEQPLVVRYQRTIGKDSIQSLLKVIGAHIVELAEERHVVVVQASDSVRDRLVHAPWVRSVTRLAAAVSQNLEARILTRAIEVIADTCDPPNPPNRFNLNGSGVSIAVFDVGYPHHANSEGRMSIINDCGVPGLEICGPISSCMHTTEVVGTLAGSGINSEPCRMERGIAPAARLYCGIAAGFFPNRLAYAAQNNGVTLANISMGVDLDAAQPCAMLGAYEGLTAELDAIAYDDSITVVVAAGNVRWEKNVPGLCPHLGGKEYGIIMPFATNKNGISVGAYGPDHGSAAFSAWGPTRGGRLKPDIVAPGIDILTSVPSDDGATITYEYTQGTSIATPVVTGIAALVTQELMRKPGLDRAMRAAGPGLVKALLLNSATDLGNPGPDFATGYGLVDAARAVGMVDSGAYLVDQINQMDTVVYTFNVKEQTDEMAVMMVYNDVPGDPVDPGVAKRYDLPSDLLDPPLIVDLDLAASEPGWPVRCHSPLTLDPQHPELPAQEGENHLDNVEQIAVRSPKPGEWTIRVIARSLMKDVPAPDSEAVQSPTFTQRYSLTWRGVRLVGRHVNPHAVPAINPSDTLKKLAKGIRGAFGSLTPRLRIQTQYRVDHRWLDAVIPKRPAA